MRHTPADLDEVFQRLGLSCDFEPQAWIGEGASAQVYRAVHRVTNQAVALKVWDRLSPRERSRFLREVDVMRHATSGRRDDETCVVDLLWAGEARGSIYPVAWVAMGLYECSLADRLSDSPALPVDDAARICRDMLTGLTTLHAAGILHRDVKPANVLLRDGRGVLSDFGLAARSGDEITCLNAGTPGYLAPELDGAEPAAPSVRSDIYAAGMTVQAAIGRSVGRQQVRRVIAKATDPDPDARYATADQLADALERALAADVDVTPEGRAPHRRRRAVSALVRGRVSAPKVAAAVAATALVAALTLPLPAGAPQTPAPAPGRVATAGTSADAGREARPLPALPGSPAVIASPASGATVRRCEVFTGTASRPMGTELFTAMRNLDNGDPAWYFQDLYRQPAAGESGPWSGPQFFGSGDGSVGQRYEVLLVAVGVDVAVPDDIESDRLGEIVAEGDRLATATYERVKGVPLGECSEP